MSVPECGAAAKALRSSPSDAMMRSPDSHSSNSISPICKGEIFTKVFGKLFTVSLSLIDLYVAVTGLFF